MSSSGAISTTAASLEQMAIFMYVYAAVNMNVLKGVLSRVLYINYFRIYSTKKAFFLRVCYFSIIRFTIIVFNNNILKPF